MVSVQSTVDTGHEDMVHDAQMDYYGTRLATCSSDKSVKIFEVKDGTQTLVTDLRGHEGPVWQVAWAHPKFGSILATCSYDRKVILWREDRPSVWSKMYEVTNHDSSVNSVEMKNRTCYLVRGRRHVKKRKKFSARNFINVNA